MKRKSFILIVFLFSALFSSCNFSSTATVENARIDVGNNLNVNNVVQTPKVESTTQNTSVSNNSNPEITVFDLVLIPNDKNKEISIKMDDFFGYAEIKSGAEFDILNEYGFLAKGKFVKYVEPSKNSKGYWIVEILKDTLRTDFVELSNTRMLEMEKESPTIPAYGVFPAKSARENIRSGDKVDMSENAISRRQAVFMSLPDEIKENANVYSQKGQLEYPNRWADSDGDGQIDFVYIRVRCEAEPNSHCGKYLYLQDGNWSELPKKIDR